MAKRKKEKEQKPTIVYEWRTIDLFEIRDLLDCFGFAFTTPAAEMIRQNLYGQTIEYLKLPCVMRTDVRRPKHRPNVQGLARITVDNESMALEISPTCDSTAPGHYVYLVVAEDFVDRVLPVFLARRNHAIFFDWPLKANGKETTFRKECVRLLGGTP